MLQRILPFFGIHALLNICNPLHRIQHGFVGSNGRLGVVAPGGAQALCVGDSVLTFHDASQPFSMIRGGAAISYFGPVRIASSSAGCIGPLLASASFENGS